MNLVERNMMLGMISVLNEASKRQILTKEQYDTRLADLKQFEEETNFAFINSPTCEIEIDSMVKIQNISTNLKKCNDIEDIIDFANQKEMLVYPRISGVNVEVIYVDGVITELKIGNSLINLCDINNIPCRINKSGVYIVSGVISFNHNLYVDNVVADNSTLKDGLIEAKELGFDVVPHWSATNFNYKNLQSNIDYVFEYAKENEFLCNGVTFRFNDTSYNKDGITYEVLE